MRLSDNVKITMPDLPAAAATGFTTATNCIDMANYRRARIILALTQAGAGTATVTLKQAAAADGSDEKALTFAGYLKNETGVTTDALTAVEATTLTTAGPTTGLNVYVFEVRSEELDQANSFRYLRMNVASISNNTAAAMWYELYDCRNTAGADDMPTGISA